MRTSDVIGISRRQGKKGLTHVTGGNDRRQYGLEIYDLVLSDYGFGVCCQDLGM